MEEKRTIGIKPRRANRILIVSAIALMIPVFYVLITRQRFSADLSPKWLLFLAYILVFNIASEGNVLIDRVFNKRMPWFIYPKRRLVRQLVITLAWTLSVTIISVSLGRLLFFDEMPSRFPSFAFFAYLVGLFSLITFNGIILANSFFLNWKKSLLENEKLKREKLKSDYKLLQDQINPHFLFNSFNVLISEISHNPVVAKEFATKLSQVYRYVLQSNKQELVRLSEELLFLKSYVYLHEIRIGDSIQFSMEIDADCLSLSIPPLTLQILVENAIKHNTANTDNILKIELKSEENGHLKVRNNLNPKSTIESTKTGLMNIKNRYKLLGDFEIQVNQNQTHFEVVVPLLDR